MNRRVKAGMAGLGLAVIFMATVPGNPIMHHGSMASRSPWTVAYTAYTTDRKEISATRAKYADNDPHDFVVSSIQACQAAVEAYNKLGSSPLTRSSRPGNLSLVLDPTTCN